MDITVPDEPIVLNVTDTSNQTAEPAPVRQRSSSFHINPDAHKNAEKRKQEELEYLNKAGITQSLGALLAKVMREKPEDPLITIANDLRRGTASSLPAADIPDPRTYLSSASGPDAEYISKHSLQNVVDEMVKQMVEEKPQDVEAYCLSWLRWNCKSVLEMSQRGK
eukprot:PhF_6_TR44269/c1_g1_i6/m.68195